MALRELNFITGNKNKLTEVQAILGSVVHLQSQSLDLVEIQGTIEEISADKCQRAAELVPLVEFPRFQRQISDTV
jgi:inosine triphosphate pyrophosphatase